MPTPATIYLRRHCIGPIWTVPSQNRHCRLTQLYSCARNFDIWANRDQFQRPSTPAKYHITMRTLVRRLSLELSRCRQERQCKYLNNIVEQVVRHSDHRFIKRRTRPMLGFKSFWSARATLAGIELWRMLKKGQNKSSLSAWEQFYALALTG